MRQLHITTPLLLFIMLFSCKKEGDVMEQVVPKHHLEKLHHSKLKKEQAVVVFDSTALRDSATFADPPTDRQYQWKVIPDNGCAAFSGKYKNGLASITFNCSGKYQIFAAIYDSANQKLVGSTDTTIVEVSNDVLYPAQPIKSDDVLNLRPSIVKRWQHPRNPNTDPPDEISMQIIYSTTHTYEAVDFIRHTDYYR